MRGGALATRAGRELRFRRSRSPCAALAAVLLAAPARPARGRPGLRPFERDDPGCRAPRGPAARRGDRRVHRAAVGRRGARDLERERRLRGGGAPGRVRGDDREPGRASRWARRRCAWPWPRARWRPPRSSSWRCRRPSAQEPPAGAPRPPRPPAPRRRARRRPPASAASLPVPGAPVFAETTGSGRADPVRAGDLLRGRRVPAARRDDRAARRRVARARVYFKARPGRRVLLRRDDAGDGPLLRQAAAAAGRGEPDHVLRAVDDHGVRGEPDAARSRRSWSRTRASAATARSRPSGPPGAGDRVLGLDRCRDVSRGLRRVAASTLAVGAVAIIAAGAAAAGIVGGSWSARERLLAAAADPAVADPGPDALAAADADADHDVPIGIGRAGPPQDERCGDQRPHAGVRVPCPQWQMRMPGFESACARRDGQQRWHGASRFGRPR